MTRAEMERARRTMLAVLRDAGRSPEARIADKVAKDMTDAGWRISRANQAQRRRRRA